jgi:molybdopterin molybdotransferase
MPIRWTEARETAWRAGFEARGDAEELSFAEASGSALAAPLTAAGDLPAFPTSAVDGWAVAGAAAPWRIVGEVLAGSVPQHLEDGDAVRIATGAQVPEGATGIIRLENGTRLDDVHLEGPVAREWRETGEEAKRGEELLPVGTRVTPPVLGLAAAAGRSTLLAHRRPASRVVVFGDELLTLGASRDGKVRDSLGPMLPEMLAAAGAEPDDTFDGLGPVADTIEDHIHALLAATADAALTCTTGGTMHGPVDHLHQTLEHIGAEYIVNTVAVRPGFPMLLARTNEGRFIAGLPGNPQSAVVALVSLVVPLLAGLRGLPIPELAAIELAEAMPGRGDYTHLALVDRDGRPLPHHGSAMLRGLASAAGFAVIAPGGGAERGAVVPLVPIPGVAS